MSFRRFFSIAQMILEKADPAAYASHYHVDPLRFDYEVGGYDWLTYMDGEVPRENVLNAIANDVLELGVTIPNATGSVAL